MESEDDTNVKYVTLERRFAQFSMRKLTNYGSFPMKLGMLPSKIFTRRKNNLKLRKSKENYNFKKIDFGAISTVFPLTKVF